MEHDEETTGHMGGDTFEFGPFELDTAWNELRRAGTAVRTPMVVFRLLEVLISEAPRAVTREQLMTRVWKGRRVGPNALTVTVARARTVLGHQRGVSEFIATLSGKGYRFLPKVVRVAGSSSALRPARSLAPSEPRPLVGRSRELELLRATMDDVRSGHGVMWVIKGEAGVGKTHLVEAFERTQPRSEVCIAWGFCREAPGTPPLWPWLRVVRDVFSDARMRLTKAREHALLRELELLRGAIDKYDRGELAAPSEQGLGEDQLRRELLIASIVRLLLLATRAVRLLLVIEDLHRADPASLDLLEHALEQIGDARICIVATLNPVALRHQGHGQVARLLTHAHTRQTVLARLGEQEVSSYLRQITGETEPELAHAIHAGSRGNPFIMAELTRQWMARGRADPTSVALTEVARACMLHRVTLLSGRARNFLSAASVIGRSFELPMLATITGLDPEQLAACVEEAISVEVCIVSVDARQTCAFSHEVQRKVLYEELSPSARRAWHLRIAKVLAARATLCAQTAASEIAHHYFEALPETDLRQTIHWCREAARAAAEACAHAEVVRHTKRAFEALNLLPQPSPRLRMHLLDTLCLYARASDATTYRWAARALLTLAIHQRDGKMIVRAALMLNLHPGFQPLGGAATVLERVLSATSADELGLRAAALSTLAVSAPICFTEQAYPLMDEAVALARKVGAPGARQVAILHQLYLYGGSAHAERANELAREAEQLGHDDPSTLPMLSADVALHRSVVALQRGNHPAIRGAIDGAMIRARKLGNEELLWYAERFRALAKLNVGRLAQGATQLDALHRQAEAKGLFGTEALCAFDRIVSLRALRDLPPATEPLERALAHDPSDPPSVWSMKLRGLATLGSLDKAWSTLRAVSSAEALRRLPTDAHFLGTLGHVARAVVRLGALDYAEAAYDMLAPCEPYFSGQQSFYCEGSVPHLRGMLARTLGRYDEAALLLQRGVEMNERGGFGPLTADAQLELARCLWQRGQRGDRDRIGLLVCEARTRAEALGMYGLCAEIAQLIRELVPATAGRRASSDAPKQREAAE